jgi:hypothetical protein
MSLERAATSLPLGAAPSWSGQAKKAITSKEISPSAPFLNPFFFIFTSWFKNSLNPLPWNQSGF